MKHPTTEMIETCLANWLDYRRNIIVPNISWGAWVHECDIFVIRKSGYAAEYEIKRNLTDLKGELKKKHNHESNFIRQFFFVIPVKVFENNLFEVKQIIPERAGIITYEMKEMKKYNDTEYWGYSIIEPYEINFKQIRNAKANPAARRLKPDEIANIARLGTMRIWSLKSRLVKTQMK